MRVVDMIGIKVGLLTVISRAITKPGEARWNCTCDCGNTSIVSGRNLRSGNVKSCGCLNVSIARALGQKHGGSKKIHGHAKGKDTQASRTYSSWAEMKRRCDNPKAHSFPAYGGKGIRYSVRWASFENFLEDMGERPEGTSLDRIDGSKGYFPGNCRWATPKEQAANRRSSVLIEFQGESLLLSYFARKLGMGIDIVWYRLNKRRMTPEEIATTPINASKNTRGKTL